MYFGAFYLGLPDTLPALNMTTWYFVAFVLIIFALSRPFKSFFRPYVLLLADIIFLISFSLYDLLAIVIIATFAFIVASILKTHKNKYLLYMAIGAIVLTLLFYKYHRFITSEVFIMPLGLSFYSFKIMAYLFDLYRGKIEHSYNPLDYYNYVLFFPTLTAGPINRPQQFLKELHQREPFDYKDSKNGGFQMCLGIFEKIVFCDFIGLWVNAIFMSEGLGGVNLLFGFCLYSFQIYLDFDSVSNIAIGAARLFGFHLERNFRSPYLAKNLKEFWRRWHISLSSWLRDYVYIPLGGSRCAKWRHYLNIMITFIVSGAWHGSTKNYLIWGFGHGAIQIIENIFADALRKVKVDIPKYFRYILDFLKVSFNFLIVTVLWSIFRFTDMRLLFKIVPDLFTKQAFDYSLYGMVENEFVWLILILIAVIILDILRDRFDLLEKYAKLPFVFRWLGYVLIVVVFVIFGVYGADFAASDFIYQFF